MPSDDVLSGGLELLCVEISPRKSESILVVALYRPPNDYFDCFSMLERALSSLERKAKEINFLGDTNCDLVHKPTGQP